MVEQSDAPDPGTPLQVRTESVPGALIVAATGEIDMLTATRFDQEVQRAIAQSPQRLILDLTGVTFLSSAGLALLVRARKECADTHVVATSTATLRPIELMGLQDDLPVHADLTEALNA